MIGAQRSFIATHQKAVGRPRKRWLDEVAHNWKQTEVGGWRRQAQNGDEWRSILKEAKVLHGQ
jgi:hypothetical protein